MIPLSLCRAIEIGPHFLLLIGATNSPQTFALYLCVIFSSFVELVLVGCHVVIAFASTSQNDTKLDMVDEERRLWGSGAEKN